MSIHTFGEKIKGYKAVLLGWAGERRQVLIYIGILAGTAVIAFYIGYVARAESAKASPVVINCPAEAYMSPQGTSQTLSSSVTTAAANHSNQSIGSYVASQNGKKYYPIGCAGANRIKDQNKIFFQTQMSAQAAGYTLAQACN